MWWPTSTSRLWLGCLLFAVRPAEAAFEITGAGAQSTALGGTFGAGANSAETVWHNPAFSARLRAWQAATTTALLHPGLDELLSIHGLAAAGPLKGGVVQAGLSYLGADGWSENVAALGYARALQPRIAVGGAVRTRAWTAGELSHRAWGLDLGATYEVGYVLPDAFLRVGLVLKDTNRPNLAAGGQAAGRAPRGLVVSASLSVGQRHILLDVERRDGRTEVRGGYESTAIGLTGVRFRAGGSALGPGWAGEELNVGIGNQWRRWYFDYAYTYPLQVSALGGMHRFSLRYRWR